MLDLKNLVLLVVAFRQQCDRRQAEKWVKDHENSLPAEVSALFKPWRRPPDKKGLRILDWLRLSKLQEAQEAANNSLKVEAILRYLESQMEISHDHHNT